MRRMIAVPKLSPVAIAEKYVLFCICTGTVVHSVGYVVPMTINVGFYIQVWNRKHGLSVTGDIELTVCHVVAYRYFSRNGN